MLEVDGRCKLGFLRAERRIRPAGMADASTRYGHSRPTFAVGEILT
jgi:hypothetical protein